MLTQHDVDNFSFSFGGIYFMNRSQYMKSFCKSKNILILLLLYVSTVHATLPLSNEAKISMLIGAPNSTSVFSIFGHASIRVYDPELKLDYIFNYGVFDSSNIGNIKQLIQGNLYCELWVYDTKEYLEETKQKGIQLNEHVLNLLPEEKEAFWQHLIKMGKAQDGRYHYDIFRTNCATLPLNTIEDVVSGKIIYKDSTNWTKGSYASLSEFCLDPYPWPLFLSFLFFGNAIYEPLSFKETLFLPRYLEAAFKTASIASGTDNRPLILSSGALVEGTPEKITHSFFTPPVVGWMLFAVVMLFSFIEWKRKRYFKVIDCILFGVAGIFGLIIFLLNTVFAEWYTCFGYNLIWLHPLHFMGLVFFANKKLNKQAYCYHIFNLAALLVGAVFISIYDTGVLSVFKTMVAPYMLMLGSRSVLGLIRYHKNKK